MIEIAARNFAEEPVFKRPTSVDGLRVKRVGESIEWGKGLPELHDGLLQDAADDVFCPLIPASNQWVEGRSLAIESVPPNAPLKCRSLKIPPNQRSNHTQTHAQTRDGQMSTALGAEKESASGAAAAVALVVEGGDGHGAVPLELEVRQSIIRQLFVGILSYSVTTDGQFVEGAPSSIDTYPFESCPVVTNPRSPIDLHEPRNNRRQHQQPPRRRSRRL